LLRFARRHVEHAKGKRHSGKMQMSDFEPLAVLEQVNAQLAASKDARVALCQVLGILGDWFSCAQAGLWRLDKTGHMLQLAATMHEGDDLPEHVLPSQGLLAAALDRGEPVMLDAVKAEGGDALCREAGFVQALAVPVWWHGRVVGVLALFDYSERACSAPEVGVVGLVAGYLGAMLSADSLTEELASERERWRRLQHTIRRVLTLTDVEESLQEAVEATQALGWHKVALAIFDGEGAIERVYAVGISEEELAEYPTYLVPAAIWAQVNSGALEWAYRQGLYCVWPSEPDSLRWQPDDLVFAVLRVRGEKAIGVLRLDAPMGGLRPAPEALRPIDILATQIAYLVENARLVQQASQSADMLAQQVEELSMMHRADRELSTHLDVDRVMSLTMDWALRRTGADTGLLMLTTEDGRGLIPSVTMGYIDYDIFPYDVQHPFPIEQGIMGRAARTGKAQLVRNVRADRDYIPFIPAARSFLSVPLSMRGEVLGVLALASAQLDAFDEADVHFLERLGRRAAVALDNARLFRRVEQMANDMATLYFATQAITSTLERDAMLQRIAEAMTTALECSSAIIFDYQPAAVDVQVLAVYRLEEAVESREVLPEVQETIPIPTFPALQTVIEQQSPMVLRVADPSISQLDRQYMLEDRIHTMIFLPLLTQDELLGVAVVVEGRHDRVFSPNEISKAETLASQAAVALRQSMLYSEVLELEKLKSEMIRMASHDLRNPLNNIMGYIELLAYSLSPDGPTPDQEQYLDNLRRSAQTMGSLLEDLLTLERIESQREEGWTTFDFAGLVTEVVEEHRSSAELKQHALRFFCPPGLPSVHGSVIQIRQAVANLVSNAIKYTPDGGEIRVVLSCDGERLMLEVIDNGYGISKERQARIFERFYRAKEPGTDHISGTGLGLSLVKTVIERHGGQVWFTSELGEGSTFGFWLPAVLSEE